MFVTFKSLVIVLNTGETLRLCLTFYVARIHVILFRKAYNEKRFQLQTGSMLFKNICAKSAESFSNLFRTLHYFHIQISFLIYSNKSHY